MKGNKTQELKLNIYNNLKKVPRGKVVTYKNLAESVNSKANRYVGYCMKTNTSLKIIPCYKVVKSNGEIGNYSAQGGVKKKIELLRKDGINVIGNKIDLDKYGFKV